MAQRWEDADATSRWREWLGAKFRAYAGIMIGVLAFGTIAGVGLVGAITDPEGPVPPTITQNDEEGANGNADEAHAMETHGRCVSVATAAANEAGLKGKVRADFLKTVTKDPDAGASKDEPGENCNFADALAEATIAQGAADTEPRGNKPEDAGKPAELPGKGNADG